MRTHTYPSLGSWWQRGINVRMQAVMAKVAYIDAGVAVGGQFLDGVNALEDISGLKRCDISDFLC
jgi:hypothetical protein